MRPQLVAFHAASFETDLAGLGFCFSGESSVRHWSPLCRQASAREGLCYSDYSDIVLRER